MTRAYRSAYIEMPHIACRRRRCLLGRLFATSKDARVAVVVVALLCCSTRDLAHIFGTHASRRCVSSRSRSRRRRHRFHIVLPLSLSCYIPPTESYSSRGKGVGGIGDSIRGSRSAAYRKMTRDWSIFA